VEIITGKETRTAVVVGLKFKSKKQQGYRTYKTIKESLEELSRLLKTLGIEVVRTEIQIRETPSPATYIGEGKAHRLSEFCKKNNISIAAFDEELSPAQARNLSTIFGIDVYDRTEIILEIFSEHARTKESRIQVEIAKQEFMLSRLMGLWAHFDRQKGGIGLRDAGEKQIEMDRRILRDRISKLKKDLKKIGGIRENQRKLRKDILQVALVGYTNAGKTTIMNALTESLLLVEDKLFATLDSTVKILNPENRPKILISDTVGFIDKLPHRLIASFKSTLDELLTADLILHVVDISARNYEKHIDITHGVLDELNLSHKPSFIVFNKADALKGDFLLPRILKRKYLESVVISAHRKDDIKALRTSLIDFFEKQMLDVELEIPYNLQKKISEIHRVSRIIEKKYMEDSVLLKFKIASMHYNRLELKKFIFGKIE